MIKAVFFDVDGTLLDTTEYIYQAFEYSLKKNNRPSIERGLLSPIMGKSLEDCYKYITLLDEVSDLIDAHREFQFSNSHLSKPFPQTIETLDTLRSKGIAIAAITSRARDSALETLQKADIYPLIDYFIGYEDVVTPKPDPEGIHKALTFFSLQVSEVAMVGDSPADVEAGRNAGVKTIGATYGFHGKDIVKSQPDNIIDDIKEIIHIVV